MAKQLKRVPDGYHSVTPHLVVKNTRESIEFYKKAFGAEEVDVRTGPDGKVIHAEMKIGDSPVMLNDEYPEYGALSPAGLKGSAVTMHLWVQDVDAAFKRAVDAGAEVSFPLADQFWGDRYGVVTDPSGHKWSLGTHVEDVSPEECSRRAQEWFAKHGT